MTKEEAKRAKETLMAMRCLYPHIRKNDAEWEAIGLAIEALPESSSNYTEVIAQLELEAEIERFPKDDYVTVDNICKHCYADPDECREDPECCYREWTEVGEQE